MRHGIKTKRLNRTSSHRKALLMNLSIALLKNEQIKTTVPKAKMLRPFVEKLITIAKKPSLAVSRSLTAVLGEKSVVKKLLSDVAVRSMNRPGGYTRIYKIGFRYGDMAPMAVIELVDKTVVAGITEESKAKVIKVKAKVAKSSDKIKTNKPSKVNKPNKMTKPKERKFKAAQ